MLPERSNSVHEISSTPPTTVPPPLSETQVSVIPVSDRKEHQRFLEFPYKHYKNCRHWVPPLRLEQAWMFSERRNPFFQHSRIQKFLAVDSGGEVVGRIAAIENGEHLKRYNDQVGFFGFFEATENPDVSRQLIASAGEWLKDRGIRTMRGPANPSLNEISGLLVEGFDRSPNIFMPYNHRYYEDLLLNLGFVEAVRTSAYYLHRKFVEPQRAIAGYTEIFKRYPGLSVRTADRLEAKRELNLVREIYNDAWSENWGHVPYTAAEFKHLAQLFRYFLDPELIQFLEMDGKPIGFIICVPNFSEVLAHLPNGRLFPLGLFKCLLRWKFGGIRNIRVAMMGIRKEFRNRGFDVALCLSAAQRGLEQGIYDSCELSWILDSNKIAVNGLEHFGAIRDKRYAILERGL